jgi:hypothetical protein
MGVLPGIGGMAAIQQGENPYRGADCIQLNPFNTSSTPTVGIDISATSGTSTESIITSGQKFGAGCLRITSTSGYARFNSETQWDISNGTDFTYDMWAYPTSAPSAGVARRIWSYGTGGASQLYIAQFGATGLRFHCSGTNYDYTGAGFALNTWAHVAMVRRGTTVYFFKDGVLLGTRTSDTVSYTPSSQYPRWGYGFIGYWDEFHYQKGTGRWITNFTPLDEPYTSTP